MSFLILPHQLFDKKYLSRNYTYTIYEHPHYFLKYRYNKKKLILHKASMEYYYDYLNQNGFKVKEYITYDKRLKHSYTLFDPIDDINLPKECEFIETPNFLLSREMMERYSEKTDKFVFTNFYNWSKKELDIIPDIKSRDKYNRDTLPRDIEIPDIPSNDKDRNYIDIGIKYVTSKFSKNYGNIENFIFPVTHASVKNWLTKFISEKLELFGKYQDAIDSEDSYLFHSVLSSSINISLINPIEIVDMILSYKKPKATSFSDIDNSAEGFIRQLFWREYQRYCYNYFDFNGLNYFGGKKKLDRRWYDGSIGIEPVDNCIVRGFDTGYLNHIERLMIIGNFMTLNEINPDDGFKWFMEFSCDSYEWVMHQNVLDMVFFVSGGKTMKRPYISSSNYVVKMSDYKRKEDWTEVWDELYYSFLNKYKDKLYRFRYYFKLVKNI